jgi:hypothetical protein
MEVISLYVKGKDMGKLTSLSPSKLEDFMQNYFFFFIEK